MPKAKVKVSERALLSRVNRKLAADDRMLKPTRGTAAKEELGDYYVVERHKTVGATNVDLEKFGRELGVLNPWEELVS